MKVMIDLCIVPRGIGVSLFHDVAAYEKVLAEAGLKPALHVFGGGGGNRAGGHHR